MKSFLEPKRSRKEEGGGGKKKERKRQEGRDKKLKGKIRKGKGLFWKCFKKFGGLFCKWG